MGISAGLVWVAVVETAAGAVRVLPQLADRQALARADLAAQSAALAIERAGDRVLASARLLADRPAVGQILSAGDRAGLAAWLERFPGTSDLTGCALVARGAGGPGGAGRVPRGGGRPGAGGRRPPRAGAPAGPAAARLAAIDRYVADRPLFGPAGEVVGVVETELPAAAVDGPLGTLVARLMALALVVAALATAASAVVGRWLGRPVRELTGSAARLGRGDLTPPIAQAPRREPGALAATLEDTRRQLLRLTAELRRRQAEGQAVLTGIAEGVFSVDRDRRIRYLNPQAAALLGLRQEEAMGRFCGDVLNPRDAAGERPCEDGCPIVHARFRGTARATEHLHLGGGRRRSVVITSAPPVEDSPFLVIPTQTDVQLPRRPPHP